MALATRCPHCQTVFRIVPDQLKLHRGLVRCGHCREVFDGVLHQVEPPAPKAAAPQPAPTAAAPAAHDPQADATQASAALASMAASLASEPVAASVADAPAADERQSVEASHVAEDEAHVAASQDESDVQATHAPHDATEHDGSGHHEVAHDDTHDAEHGATEHDTASQHDVTHDGERADHTHAEPPAFVEHPEDFPDSLGRSEPRLAPDVDTEPNPFAEASPFDDSHPDERVRTAPPATPPEWDAAFGELPPGAPSAPFAPGVDFGQEAPDPAHIATPLGATPPAPVFDTLDFDETPPPDTHAATPAHDEAAAPVHEKVAHPEHATTDFEAGAAAAEHAVESGAAEAGAVAHEHPHPVPPALEAHETAQHDSHDDAAGVARTAGEALVAAEALAAHGASDVHEARDGHGADVDEAHETRDAHGADDAHETRDAHGADETHEAQDARGTDDAHGARDAHGTDDAHKAHDVHGTDDAHEEHSAHADRDAHDTYRTDDIVHASATSDASFPFHADETLAHAGGAHAYAAEQTRDHANDDTDFDAGIDAEPRAGELDHTPHAKASVYGHQDEVIDVEPTSASPNYGADRTDPWAPPPDARMEPALTFAATAGAAAAGAAAGATAAATASPAFAPLSEDSGNDFRIRVEPHDTHGNELHPARRVLGWIVALLLLVLLLAQLAWWQREPIMTRWPNTVGAYRDVCAKLGCLVTPPRAIDQLQIESSTLTQSTVPNQFELAISLHNRAALALAWPSLEISLLDQNNQLVIRRVVTPGQYLPAGADLNAGLASDGHAPVNLQLTSTGAAPANYKVLIFYP